MTDTQRIKVGQVWRSRDKRDNGRMVKVVEVDLWVNDPGNNGFVTTTRAGRRSRMRANTLRTRYEPAWLPSLYGAPTSFPERSPRRAFSDEQIDAAVAAERERILAEVEALHPPFNIYDECEHDHTDEDVAEGRARDIPEVGYTCALLYVSCRLCCTTDDGVHAWPTEECADHHEHTLDPGDRCPTAALVARLRGSS